MNKTCNANSQKINANNKDTFGKTMKNQLRMKRDFFKRVHLLILSWLRYSQLSDLLFLLPGLLMRELAAAGAFARPDPLAVSLQSRLILSEQQC